MSSVRHFRRTFLLSGILALFVFAAGISAQDKDWRTVSPGDLSSTASVVEPNADAEAIFWEVRVNDSSADALALEHYVRVKIFTEKGRDDFSKKDIIFSKGMRIKEIEARVTKPDSSVTYLKKDDVMERDIVKANGIKVRAKSFALPGLEIGSIIEFKYREVINGAWANNMRLSFQHDIPIREISYFVKPSSGEFGMYYEQFNIGDTKFEKDKGGFYRATMRNVPAFREEPYMLPEDEVLSWVYLYYARSKEKDPRKYWENLSKSFYDSSKSNFKADGKLKELTASVIAGATTDDEKLRRIYDYTKQKIRNLTYEDKPSDDEIKKAWKATDGSDVLKLGYGTRTDIDRLFGSMAKAAGYDVRLAVSGDRSEMFFDPSVTNAALILNSFSVAVDVGGDWKLFSPGNRYAPYGMLGWYKEAQPTLITDPKELIWKESPLSEASKSVAKRTGKFKLLPDGTIEGDGTFEFTGHWAARNKNLVRGESPTEREDRLKTLLKSNISSAVEIKSFSIENADDPEKPFIYRFKIRVPNYGSLTGSRIFFLPNIFNNQTKPLFTAGTSKYDIYFSYPWTELDEVEIDLPAGFALENADAPSDLKDNAGIGSHVTTMGVTSDGKMLRYNRVFSFGNGGKIRFPVAAYPAVKQLFEAFNTADVHQLTLRKTAATAASKAQ